MVGHHHGERLAADPITRCQRREPVALPVPPVAHDRHGDAPPSAHLEYVAVDQVGSMARDHHHLVESRLPGAGQGTLDQADTPKLDKRLRAGLGAQPRAHTAGEHHQPSRLHGGVDLLQRRLACLENPRF